MKERLQKILSARGVASRRKAEEMITAGRVAVNGLPAVLGDTADVDVDIITVDGRPLPSPQKPVYIMLHKPRGFVTTLSDEKGRRNAAELVADCGVRVYSVGRLDMDSDGLLLFTNDGDVANRLMHPRHHVDKTYRVEVKGDPDRVPELEKPMKIDGYEIQPATVKLLRLLAPGKMVLRITIHEGRNRQIRKMCEAVGLEVKRLKRIAIGPLKLGMLQPGEWRELTKAELAALRRAVTVNN